ncbi:MAG TPA: ATP-binding protein [Acidobacteriaceae bacterium]|jgi:PAS domain S-box-containing protein
MLEGLLPLTISRQGVFRAFFGLMPPFQLRRISLTTMEARPDIPSTGTSPAETSDAHLQLLIDTGLLLASERSLDVIVQAALDAGLKLCGARFGAFFYNKISLDGEVYPLHKVSGILAAAFASFPHPRPTALFAGTFEGRAIIRSDDITRDPRYGQNPPFAGMPQGHLPVRSYLAVPVSRRGGEVLGALLYGHPDPGMFDPGCEQLVATVAAQAAVAMENARLAEGLSREIAMADSARALQRTTADRLIQVLESTTDGVTLLDRDWRFTYINRNANDLMAPGRQLIGTSFWDLVPNGLGSTFQQRYKRAMEHDERVEFTEYYPSLKLWAQVRVFPTPEGIAIFFQDVTRQHESDREISEVARRLRQALDAGQLGTWTWDKATDMLDLDERAAEILNGPAHMPVRRTDLRAKIVNREDLSGTPENLRDANLEDGGVYQAEYRVESDSGGQRWVAARGVAVYAEGAETMTDMTGMIGTVQDITTRKMQEATLRQSEKLAATGRLAATIAHEINNPLEAVTNLIYLCKTDPSVPTPVQRLLDTADTELARVAQIAQQTLGFYRDTSHPAEIDITELLHSIADLFSRKLQARNLKFHLMIDSGLYLFGLQGEVRQVFSNLLVNAIDASSQGIICVRARRRKHHGVEGISVLISDEGSGIPSNIRGRLFAPFFTTKQSIGTGLGLWVTRGIVEKSGGTVTFRSRTEPPTGTVFRVFLPTGNRPAPIFSSPNANVLQ